MAITINGDSGISGVDGSAATPALQGTDTNTGISFGTDEVNINTGGTTRVKVDSSGRVGIGTGSPSELLHVSGGHILLSNGYDIKSPDNFAIYDTTNSIDRFTYSGSNVYNTPSGGAHLFRINGTESARIISGGGITFNGDTAAANALDDYEEGTWTPAYSAEFTGTYTANGQIGRYVKVGKLVTAYFFIQVSTVSGSGNISLTGLPFATPSATNYNPGAVVHLTGGGWITNHPFSLDASGASATQYNVKYRSSSNGNTDSNIAVSNLATNAYMRATIVYEAA